MPEPRGKAKRLAEEHDARCKGKLAYAEKVDTFVCYTCKTLLETPCSDPHCKFCNEYKNFFRSE